GDAQVLAHLFALALAEVLLGLKHQGAVDQLCLPHVLQRVASFCSLRVLLEWHRMHLVLRLSGSLLWLSPSTWSTWSPNWPQSAQMYRSRASTCRRRIFHAFDQCASRAGAGDCPAPCALVPWPAWACGSAAP